MTQRIFIALFLSAVGLVALPPSAVADQVVEAGQTLALKEDLVLSGDESLDIKGTAERRCTLLGNGHRIRTKAPWTGSVRIRHCDVRKLGAAARMSDDNSR